MRVVARKIVEEAQLITAAMGRIMGLVEGVPVDVRDNVVFKKTVEASLAVIKDNKIGRPSQVVMTQDDLDFWDYPEHMDAITKIENDIMKINRFKLQLEGPSFSLGLTQMCETSHHMHENVSPLVEHVSDVPLHQLDIGQGVGKESASEIIGDVLVQLQQDDVADASKGHGTNDVETDCGVSIVKGKSVASDVTYDMAAGPGEEGATRELEKEQAVYKRKGKGRVRSKNKI